MFCPKCGNNIPDGSAFCASCGNRVGDAATNGAGYRSTYSTGPSPLAKSLVSKLAGFFTTTRQEAVVTDAAKDTTWSGAIVAAICVVVFILTQLANVGAAVRGYAQVVGVSYTRAWDIDVEILVPFLFSMLFAVLYAGALAGMTFAMARMCKVKLPFVCAVNVAAYASLSIAAANIVGLLLGLIWGPLAILCFFVGMIASFMLIYQALIKAYGMKRAFLPMILFLFAMMLIVVIGAMVIFSYSL